MSDAADGYWATLGRRFGDGWNRFWFEPSDPLPLGVVRIGIGGIALWLVATYAFDLRRFFDPQIGLLPLETVVGVQSQTDRAWRFSYLDFATDAATLQAMHYAGVLVLLAITVGLFTRVTSVMAWVVFLSYQHRGPMLTNLAEPIVCFLLFYLALGPSGAAPSVDALRKRRSTPDFAPAASYGATVALRLIQVHVALVYFLMFCGKMQNSVNWWSGTAVWWLAARPESTLVDLRWIYQRPYLVNVWTTAILLFEPAFAFLVWNRTVRPLILGLSALHWAGIALLTGLVPFALAMFVAGLAFVPAEFWRRRPAT